jgi:hypothetical protein
MPAGLLGDHTKSTVDRKADLLSAANSLIKAQGPFFRANLGWVY